MSNQSAFNKEAVEFYMAGKAYKYYFIPNIHLTEILNSVVDVVFSVRFDAKEGTFDIREGVEKKTLMDKVYNLLVARIYTIIEHVIKYQNKDSEQLSADDLVYLTSPMELARFVEIVLSDDELVDAVEVMVKGLGKFQKLLGDKIPSLTESFTQFFLRSSEETPNS